MLIILNKVELLDDLLEEFFENGIKGATILKSTGMLRELSRNHEEFPLFGALRYLVDLDRQESKTIFMVVKDEQVDTARQIVKKVVGDITKPDTAVIFTLPVLSAEGVDL